jgi:WD40 repeat protein
VLCLAFSQDHSRLYTGGNDNVCGVWDLSALHDAVAAAGAAAGAAAAGGLAGTVSLLPEKHRLHSLSGHSQWVTAARVASDNSVAVTSSDDCTIRVYSYEAGAFLYALTAHEGHVRAMDIYIPPAIEGQPPPLPLLVSGGDHRNIHFWHLPLEAQKTGAPDLQPVKSLPEVHQNRIVGVTITANPDPNTSTSTSVARVRVVSACSDGTIKVFDLTGKLLAEFTVGVFGKNEVRAITTVAPSSSSSSSSSSSPGPRLMVVGGSHFLIADLDSQTTLYTSQPQSGSGKVHAAQFSEDGSKIVTGDESNVRIWEIATLEVEGSLADYRR